MTRKMKPFYSHFLILFHVTFGFGRMRVFLFFALKKKISSSLYLTRIKFLLLHDSWKFLFDKICSNIFLLFKIKKKVMSREEANRLSSLRRDELRKNRELESNRALRIKNMLKVSLLDFIWFVWLLFN